LRALRGGSLGGDQIVRPAGYRHAVLDAPNKEVAGIMTSTALTVPAQQLHHVLHRRLAGDHPRDAPQAFARVAASTEGFTFSIGRLVQGRQVAIDVLPDEADVLAAHEAAAGSSTWAHCLGGAVLVVETPNSTEIIALASSPTAASRILDEVVDRCKEPLDKDVRAALWLASPDGPSRRLRTFSTPSWQEIARNYPERTAASLTALCAAGPPSGTGRLLLWHGPPGTGKTSAVLALLDAWRDWCGADVIVDPERMFLDASYLVDVLAASVTSQPWRLIVCEDADEYLRSDARQRSGAGLGRLLNASDGLLGRGSRSMILLTTNDEVGRLHPAVTRPGRCMSLVEFGLLPRSVASAWLGEPVHDAMSLADLYERQRGGRSSSDPLPIGAYL
jgi:hypothetical protein